MFHYNLDKNLIHLILIAAEKTNILAIGRQKCIAFQKIKSSILNSRRENKHYSYSNLFISEHLRQKVKLFKFKFIDLATNI